MKTVVGVFSSLEEAERTERDLKNLGIPRENISIVAGNDANRHKEYLEKAKVESTSTGAAAASGASFGGGIGLAGRSGVSGDSRCRPDHHRWRCALLTLLTGLGIGAAGGGLIAAFLRAKCGNRARAGAYLRGSGAARGGHRQGLMSTARGKTMPLPSWSNMARAICGMRSIRGRLAGWSGPSVDPHRFLSATTLSALSPRNTCGQQEGPIALRPKPPGSPCRSSAP